MTDLLTPANTVTFTITKLPRQEAKRKTLVRLMQLQPEVKKGLKMLQRRRKQKDNKTYIRAGVPWTNRKRATKLVWLEVGSSFTLTITPQIIPDLNSVSDYVDAAAA